MEFNNEQIEAITTNTNEPVLVLAGAGTGKTSVLTNRIIHLLEKENYDQNRILAITFTNKAGFEIKKRIEYLGKNISWIGTFHSICLRILKRDINILNRNENFKIIDTEDSLKIIKEIISINNINKNKISVKNALSHIDKIKRKYSSIGFDYNLVEDYCLSENDKEISLLLNDLAKIWREYENKLLSLNYLDFNDLLSYAHKILKENENKRKYWKNYFQYVLVDEFQDTNNIQYEIVSFLSNEKNIFCVGDIDQTIYSFRGANPKIINKYIYDFKPKTIILKTNYRSTQSILNISNDLIDKNTERIKKSLFSFDSNNVGQKPIFYEAKTEELEANWVCNKILELKSKNVKLSDICILFRNNYLTRVFEQELIFNNIPYKVFGSIRFFERKEIKDILAYLNIVDSYDELSLRRVINTPTRKIGLTTIDKLSEIAKIENLPFLEILKNSSNYDIPKIASNNIKKFLSLIEKWKNEKFNSMVDLVETIINDTNYLEYLKKEESNKINSIKENINELKKALFNFEQNNPVSENKLNDFLQTVALMNTNSEIEDEVEKVKLMTVHNAKGLEFENVFLVSFNQNTFPSHHSTFSKKDLEEERRVAYVALTRAKKNLYITCNNDYDFRIGISKSRSQFLNEIDSSLIEKYEYKKNITNKIEDAWFDSLQRKDSLDLSQKFDKNITISDFKKGDLVSHISFGSGIITNIDEDGVLTIDFKKPIGTKKILFNHKSIIRTFR